MWLDSVCVHNCLVLLTRCKYYFILSNLKRFTVLLWLWVLKCKMYSFSVRKGIYRHFSWFDVFTDDFFFQIEFCFTFIWSMFIYYCKFRALRIFNFKYQFNFAVIDLLVRKNRSARICFVIVNMKKNVCKKLSMPGDLKWRVCI